MNGDYDDIIHLPHPVSTKHPRMSAHDRAAQFSPFAALTGYSDAIRRVNLKTDRKIDLTDEEERAINATLHDLLDAASEQPSISAVCFEPNGSEEGGTYVALEGFVKRVDVFDQSILLTDGRHIPFKSIFELKYNRTQKRIDT